MISGVERFDCSADLSKITDQHTKRQVYIKMRKFIMFVTAVCVLFLIKQPNLSIDTNYITTFQASLEGCWSSFLYASFQSNHTYFVPWLQWWRKVISLSKNSFEPKKTQRQEMRGTVKNLHLWIRKLIDSDLHDIEYLLC